ncbi:MAG TPA: SRPBCC domain-containing protein [Pirellulaceae bacterium]|jgi:carbon monoxide dehydrogenase subunit G
MNFSGSEHFDCTQSDLWPRLTDMAFISRVIPDVDKVERLEPTSFTCKVRPRFSFLTGSLELSFTVIESEPEQRLVVRSRGKGIGAAIVVDIEILLATAANSTDLNWTGTIVSREGLLKPVNTSLIQGAAERVIHNLWQNFRTAFRPAN